LINSAGEYLCECYLITISSKSSAEPAVGTFGGESNGKKTADDCLWHQAAIRRGVDVWTLLEVRRTLRLYAGVPIRRD